jgi:hypothetical protein
MIRTSASVDPPIRPARKSPRWHVVRSFLPLVCFVALVVPEAGAQTRYALLIGIDHYQPKGAAPHRPSSAANAATPDTVDGPSRWDLPVWPTLEGAVNDARSMRDLLASAKFGFPEQNIQVLTNAEATREGILAAMQKFLVDQPQRGDIVVFYYAGHGSLRVNSKNGRPDHFDETIVPVDANSGVFDIRNKEIARLLNAAIDKGVLLTAIFDSCHSGGVARGIPVGAPGKTRFLPYDPRDALDPPDRGPGGRVMPRPEDRTGGALVLAGAQAHELASEWTAADGTPHGAFTVALMDTLSRLPADSSAEQILGRVTVLMQGMGLNAQQPALDAPPDRRRASLFGSKRGSEKLTVAVGPDGVRPDGTLTIEGGLELGLNPGCELERPKLNPGEAAVRVRISSAALGHATARLIPPAAARQVEPGDEFALEKWAAPEPGRLRLWIPPALPAAELASAAAEAAKLRGSGAVTWVDDPVRVSPAYLVQWNGSAWTLTGAARAPQVLGRNFSAGAVIQALARSRIKSGRTSGTTSGASPAPRLFVDLPPSQELAARLRSQFGEARAALEVAPAPETAQYLLAGRAGGAAPEYAWVQKNVSLGRSEPTILGQDADEDGALCSPESPYPPRTDWFAPPSADQGAERLAEHARRLARVYSWLNLPAPAAGAAEAFPYQLVLEKLSPEGSEPASPPSSAALTDRGPVREGESYGLALRAQTPPPDDFKPRWVYVLGISCDGSGRLLYPLSGQNNRQPRRDPDTDAWPGTADLTGSAESIAISKPFGVDTYVLLTTSDQLSDLSVFNFEAALSRGAAPAPADPLSRLLESASTGSRGMGAVQNVPASWSVRYTHILSIPAATKP